MIDMGHTVLIGISMTTSPGISWGLGHEFSKHNWELQACPITGINNWQQISATWSSRWSNKRETGNIPLFVKNFVLWACMFPSYFSLSPFRRKGIIYVVHPVYSRYRTHSHNMSPPLWPSQMCKATRVKGTFTKESESELRWNTGGRDIRQRM